MSERKRNCRRRSEGGSSARAIEEAQRPEFLCRWSLRTDSSWYSKWTQSGRKAHRKASEVSTRMSKKASRGQTRRSIQQRLPRRCATMLAVCCVPYCIPLAGEEKRSGSARGGAQNDKSTGAGAGPRPDRCGCRALSLARRRAARDAADVSAAASCSAKQVRAKQSRPELACGSTRSREGPLRSVVPDLRGWHGERRPRRLIEVVGVFHRRGRKKDRPSSAVGSSSLSDIERNSGPSGGE